MRSQVPALERGTRPGFSLESIFQDEINYPVLIPIMPCFHRKLLGPEGKDFVKVGLILYQGCGYFSDEMWAFYDIL